MKIRPVFDRLTVEKVEQAGTTKSGLIVLPDDAKAPSQMGRVLAVGHGRNYDGPGALTVMVPQTFNVRSLQPGEQPPTQGTVEDVPVYRVAFERPRMVVKVGDLVIYGKYSGAEVEVDGTKVFILREDEVLGIVDEEPETKATQPTEQANPEGAPVH